MHQVCLQHTPKPQNASCTSGRTYGNRACCVNNTVVIGQAINLRVSIQWGRAHVPTFCGACDAVDEILGQTIQVVSFLAEGRRRHTGMNST